jgi:pectin methylesterase-like acyl-CoA thioesterase
MPGAIIVVGETALAGTLGTDFGPFTSGTHTSGIQEAIDSLGGNGCVHLSAGDYQTSQTIHVKSGVSLIGAGAGATRISLALPSGNPAIPVLSCEGSEVTISDLSVDGSGKTLTSPAKAGHDVASGSAILVQSNRSKISRVNVDNSWDNGIMILQFSGQLVNVNLNSPENVVISDCQTSNCGLGDHGGGQRAGAGIDVGGGNKVCVSNCVDIASSTGFIVDFYAGAECSLTGCAAYFSADQGFWIGSATLITACKAVSPGTDGFVFDPAITWTKWRGRVVSCLSVHHKRFGFNIRSDNVSFTACTADGDPSATSVAGFFVDSERYMDPGNNFIQDNISITLVDCSASNHVNGHGYNESVATNATVGVAILGGRYTVNNNIAIGINGYFPNTIGVQNGSSYSGTDENRRSNLFVQPPLTPGHAVINSCGRSVNVYIFGDYVESVDWYPVGGGNGTKIADGSPATVRLRAWELIQVNLRPPHVSGPTWVWVQD